MGAFWLYALFYFALGVSGACLVVIADDLKKGIACFIALGIVAVLFIVSQLYFIFLYRRRVITHIINHFYY